MGRSESRVRDSRGELGGLGAKEPDGESTGGSRSLADKAERPKAEGREVRMDCGALHKPPSLLHRRRTRGIPPHVLGDPEPFVSQEVDNPATPDGGLRRSSRRSAAVIVLPRKWVSRRAPTQQREEVASTRSAEALRPFPAAERGSRE